MGPNETSSLFLNEDLRLLRETIRRFIDERVSPAGEQWESDGMVPRDILIQMGQLGLLGMRHPEAYGGSAMPAMASLLLSEELGRSTHGGFSATVLVHTDMASPHLTRYGSKEQQTKWLPGICSGEILTAIAVTEPGAGSDVANMRTRAIRDGNEFTIEGSKTFITNGVNADLYFVAAKTNPDVKGSRGISIFAIEKNTPGFQIAKRLEKHGWHCSDTAELVFQDCKVPAGNLLGKENEGFYAIMDNFQNERLVLGGQAIGEASKAIEITLEYLRQREAFGAPLWNKEAIRQRISMMAAKVESVRHFAYHIAWLDEQGTDCVKEVSMLKALSAEIANETIYDCLQFHGGMGYMRESTNERMARDARLLPIGGGATEVMLEEVAKRL